MPNAAPTRAHHLGAQLTDTIVRRLRLHESVAGAYTRQRGPH
jgi:hypothetical protein